MLTILYVVNINVFHAHHLFKCTCSPLKLVVVFMHGWQITQKAKLVAKNKKINQRQIKAKQTEIKPEKGQTFT